VKVDHSPRHYYAAQQTRLHPTASRYETSYDYDYSGVGGGGGGYANSFSTSEAHPLQASYSAYPSTYHQGPPMHATAMYPGTSQQLQQPQPQQQPQYYSQTMPTATAYTAASPYGYTYGYAGQPQTSRQPQAYDPRAQQYNQRQF
jgi:hypothetical protein